VDYAKFVRPLELPAGYAPPVTLEYADITARALGRADLDDDVRGINASVELIRRTRGGDWPSGPITAEYDYVDLVWHECEFRENYSFSYAVYETGGLYLGCCYLYPMGRRTPLSENLLQSDVDVSWWVTAEAYQRGYYAKLDAALRQWIAEDFPFAHPHFSNREIPQGIR
jgi:hypothetical protein